MPLDTQTLKITQDTQKLSLEISQNVILKHIIKVVHLYIIPMTLYKDIKSYFDKFKYMFMVEI